MAESKMTITSDEVNFLIYRYLQESGFQHTAFTFFAESMLERVPFNPADAPHGALISYLQKGLQYSEIETHLKEDGSEVRCDTNFSLITPHICSVADDDQMKDCQEWKNVESTHVHNDEPDIQVPQSDVVVLSGHTSEVLICSWSPTENLLASGSGDTTARVWSIPHAPCDEWSSSVLQPIILRHSQNSDESSKQTKDVTTLNWSCDGSLLATGSYDGKARIWDRNGVLQKMLFEHKGPIFAVKWNSDGNKLLSGSIDKTAIVWDVQQGKILQQFEFHTAPTLDVDWKDNDTFATCSTDKKIFVCKLGETNPLAEFSGHSDEVNAIKWDPAGNFLASCSDDHTAKIWSLEHSNCIWDLTEHTRDIYTIEWSPTGENSNNPNLPLLLASASFDSMVKLWNIETGSCLYTLCDHKEPVYAVSFSPDSRFLASGSFDRCVHIWNTKDGKLIKTYVGGGGVFGLDWNSAGDKVAASFSDNTVCVIDMRM